MLSVVYHSCNSCLNCFFAILGKTHRCEFELELIKRSIVFDELDLELKNSFLCSSL